MLACSSREWKAMKCGRVASALYFRPPYRTVPGGVSRRAFAVDRPRDHLANFDMLFFIK